MAQQVDDLLGAVQSVLHGKLPIRFINPIVLQHILRNVSLHLPEECELVAGTRMDNIHLYYEVATVTLVGNAHGIKVIVNVPLKTASQRFTLYKIIVLPSRMSDYNFVKYVTEFSYFVLDESHRDYILLTEAHRIRCTKSSITLCPADIAIYNAQTVTCVSSLFFQDTSSKKLCRRNFIFDYRHPTLQRNRQHWLYHLSKKCQVTYRFPSKDSCSPAQKPSQMPDLYTTLRSAPSQPTIYEHCQTSIEKCILPSPPLISTTWWDLRHCRPRNTPDKVDNVRRSCTARRYQV
jgi:hypothetical protein